MFLIVLCEIEVGGQGLWWGKVYVDVSKWVIRREQVGWLDLFFFFKQKTAYEV